MNTHFPRLARNLGYDCYHHDWSSFPIREGDQFSLYAATMPSSYDKPFLDVDAQIRRLASLGMAMSDQEFAQRTLRAVGYYRLSGYWYGFRKVASVKGAPRPSEFADGTSLNEVVEIYSFDAELRAEMLRALSQIEVALRSAIGHHLGKRGPFSHLDPEQVSADWGQTKHRHCTASSCSEECTWVASDHHQWIEKQRRVEGISNEAYVAHIYSNYGDPLPIWTATETMTFEMLSRLFAGMTVHDREQIAAEFDLFRENGNGDSGAFINWIQHLRQARNVCAHHARLWNRNHSTAISVPHSVAEMQHLLSDEMNDNGARTIASPAVRTYGTLVLIAYLLSRIDSSNVARDRLRNLVVAFAGENADRLTAMGFPRGWEQEAVWQAGYARSAQLSKQAEIIHKLEILLTKEATEKLSVKETEADRRSLLKYYRKKGALLSIPGITAHRFPSFQFDEKSGDIHSIVVLANRRLLGGTYPSESVRWEAAKWWVTSNATLDDLVSPVEALGKEALTKQVLDGMLPPRDDEDR
ncbi:Abi family protein [Mycetocola tolaasinivorans]|uniref:Abi family protein n=1 Tax=Mycetocola tolaasinivorans TaxID=76635 RepID=UPI001600DF66|nr:Abi family protein [Mycetocola tolaasinivorans]